MPIDSDNVGCGWIVLPMSTASAPISIASPISLIRSPACVPTMPPPMMRCVASSKISFVKPSSRPLAIARPPMLAHKAVHEGHVAAEAASGMKSYFDARQIPSVAYTDPEVAWTGITEDECKANGTKYGKAVFPWSACGRAIANGRDEGFTKLLFDEATHRIIGGGVVGAQAGDLISEIGLAIEMGADAVDIGRTIHPHPTLSESVGLAAEAYEGVCTDLPPPRRK